MAYGIVRSFINIDYSDDALGPVHDPSSNWDRFFETGGWIAGSVISGLAHRPFERKRRTLAEYLAGFESKKPDDGRGEEKMPRNVAVHLPPQLSKCKGYTWDC